MTVPSLSFKIPTFCPSASAAFFTQLSTHMATINGTTGNDRLNGTASDDSIYASDGNDIVDALDGNDAIDGWNGDDTLYGEAGNDSLYGYYGNDYLFGGPGTDNLNGEEGDDTLLGGYGLDSLYGGSGSDSLLGYYGNDYFNGGSGNDTLRGETGNDYLDGLDGDDLLDSGSGNDTLVGYYGNDTLNGSSGNDRLRGEADNDTYIVDSAGDLVTEAANEGTDTVFASITYTLGVNLENLTLTGTSAINGTGNSFNNTLTGNAANNILSGGAGIDTLNGGVGNDIYIIDSTPDTITELINEGIDTVQSTVSYTLGANLEHLTLTGTRAINGTGNNLDNTITGNAAANSLFGSFGNDTYIVNSTLDTITEYYNSGTDTVQSSVSYTLSDNLENLSLTGKSALNGTGNAKDNTITGNAANNSLSGGDGLDALYGQAGNDRLDGELGIDSLIGGTGNDTYIVDSTTDTIVEYSNGGIDTVQSSVSFTLGANLENLKLTGFGNISGTGNSLNNTITGNTSNNSLFGGDGNDALYGLTGRDTLTGAAGADKFAFSSPTGGIDTITDFSSSQGDKIQVDASGFGGRLTIGELSSNQFTQGESAADASVRFIYNKSTWQLFFDVDGLGGLAQTQIAVFSTEVSLKCDDISVIS